MFTRACCSLHDRNAVYSGLNNSGRRHLVLQHVQICWQLKPEPIDQDALQLLDPVSETIC